MANFPPWLLLLALEGISSTLLHFEHFPVIRESREMRVRNSSGILTSHLGATTRPHMRMKLRKKIKGGERKVLNNTSLLQKHSKHLENKIEANQLNNNFDLMKFGKLMRLSKKQNRITKKGNPKYSRISSFGKTRKLVRKRKPIFHTRKKSCTQISQLKSLKCKEKNYFRKDQPIKMKNRKTFSRSGAQADGSEFRTFNDFLVDNIHHIINRH